MSIVIVGASAAGLAVAKCLADRGQPTDLIEAAPNVGTRWRSHYRRLHLHTPKSRSALPGLAFGPEVPRYPSRQQVVDYLDRYAATFGLRPQFETRVTRVAHAGDGWIVETTRGARHADRVILATGYNNVPLRAAPPGIDSFPGPVLHSSDYDSGSRFKGMRVLVVGFGNSGCEIAIDLHEQGARPAISVRGPVNVLPRDIFGVPVLALGQGMRLIPPRLADRLNAPLIRALIGDIRDLGLTPLPYGPNEQIARGQVPLLDIGTLALMRAGAITRHAGIAQIDGPRVSFADGRAEAFDAIVLATGYRHGIEAFMDLPEPEKSLRIKELSVPIARRRHEGARGLHLLGGYLSPRGMLYEIAREAEWTAKTIARAVAR